MPTTVDRGRSPSTEETLRILRKGYVNVMARVNCSLATFHLNQHLYFFRRDPSTTRILLSFSFLSSSSPTFFFSSYFTRLSVFGVSFPTPDSKNMRTSYCRIEMRNVQAALGSPPHRTTMAIGPNSVTRPRHLRSLSRRPSRVPYMSAVSRLFRRLLHPAVSSPVYAYDVLLTLAFF